MSKTIKWDEMKRLRNVEAHGLDFADAETFEWETAMIVETYASVHGGRRFMAVGFMGDRFVTMIFSLLGTEAISLISLRPASRKERQAYDDQ